LAGMVALWLRRDGRLRAVDGQVLQPVLGWRAARQYPNPSSVESQSYPEACDHNQDGGHSPKKMPVRKRKPKQKET